jgi:DNA-binding NarL/FixJ family response regulator
MHRGNHADHAMSPVRVLVVDDHIIFREGLRALLSRIDSIDVVAEAGTTKGAITAAADSHPDVILMDLHLPDGGGIEATAAILANQPDIAVLVLTMHSDDRHLRDAIRAGARGYLLKDADPDSIIRAVRAVHQRQLIFDPGIAAHVLTAAATPESSRAFPSLTDREYQILDRLARGLRNEAIAARMGISLKTVQNNVSSILLKLGAVDRAQAVALARDEGLGTP